jgi:hypothetical protein
MSRVTIAFDLFGARLAPSLLAKAASGQLARAIFNAAKSEHPERRIILRKDARVIVDSSSGKMR